jgi:O-methyltransferase
MMMMMRMRMGVGTVMTAGTMTVTTTTTTTMRVGRRGLMGMAAGRGGEGDGLDREEQRVINPLGVDKRIPDGGRVSEYCLAMQSLSASTASELARQSMMMYPHTNLMTPVHQSMVVAFLAKMVDARTIVELGVFTGLTTLTLAQMNPLANVYALDRDVKPLLAVGKPLWQSAAVDDRIHLRVGDAMQSLSTFLPGSICFVYLDADKANYINYYQKCVDLLRPGGLICIDNVLWKGKVLPSSDADVDVDNTNLGDGGDENIHNPDESDKDDNDGTHGSKDGKKKKGRLSAVNRHTSVIKKLNEIVRDDPRVDCIMLNIGDGLTLAMKKK